MRTTIGSGKRSSITEGKMHTGIKLVFSTTRWKGSTKDTKPVLREQKDKEPEKVRNVGHCFALVRLLPNSTDLYVSHDTWNTYQFMLKILKKYKMPLRKVPKGEAIPGIDMSFSSYPGVIYSGDDFNITSSGLTVLETTIGNSNPELWKFVKPHGSALEVRFQKLVTHLLTNRLFRVSKLL